MTDSRIRRAVAGDVSAIADVHVQCWRETYRGIMPDDLLASLDVASRRRLWARTIKHRSFDTFVCTGKGGSGIVGFACDGPRTDVPAPYEGEFRAIYILQEAHGQGLGRSLMSTMAAALTGRGYGSAALRVVRDSLATRAFYQHLGGIEVSEGSHNVEGITIAEVVYGWPDISVLV